MSRPSPVVPVAGLSKRVRFEITPTDWIRIETAYGRTVPLKSRRQIEIVSRDFLSTASIEHDSELISAATRRIRSIRSRAGDLQAVICEAPSEDATTFSNRFFEDAFTDRRFKKRDSLHSLSLMMDDVICACDEAEKAINGVTNHGRRRGEGWENWLRKIDDIFRELNLPITARKDANKNKSGKPSPYAEMIGALQDLFPPKFRRAKQSKQALARAIHLARTPRRDKIRT
jgi:hypothetical protein